VLELEADDLARAGKVAGLEFTEAEIALMREGVDENLRSYRRLWEIDLPNGVAPVLVFSPLLGRAEFPAETLKPVPRLLPEVERPENLEDLAFADIPTLASLIQSKKVSCLELTEMYIERLKRLDEKLACVVTLTEDRARTQARERDRELAAGRSRGILHGIPWGAKDLLATKGIRTTWGAKPFEGQVLDEDASVVRRLDEAGAILVAKLTLGALAWGDVWFGGQTKNPWKLDQGSSGSSAGPAAATAAGAVAFSIGSETYGSIVSPSSRCGNSSLRPTFGRVSRHGAMALSWSMDKLGPICRSVGDAANVFGAIQGRDPLDDSTIEAPFTDLGPIDVKEWKVGHVKGAWRSEEEEARILSTLTGLGVELVPVELPDFPVQPLLTILSVEAATAFDELTRSGRDDLLVRQVARAWPNEFRQARLIPAVEYVRANRLRRLLMIEMNRRFEGLDALVHPTGHGFLVAALNLTGHPTVCLPSGFREDGTPRSVSFSGPLFGEGRILAVAEAWQRATGHHLVHPNL